MRFLLTGIIAVAAMSAARGQDPAESAKIDFSRIIQPILSDNCYFCHGPDENQRAAGLRLDREEDAAAVIEPGDSGDSELIRRITTDDLDQRMPPVDSHRTLTAAQIQRLRQWVDAGAPWGVHWSFAPLEKPPVPSPNGAADPPLNHPIDAFVAAQLDKRDWRFSPAAPRHTLLRRLTLDLTGLPPTPEQVERFVRDRDPQAYEKQVDRLLASPAYGERMAWDWLDAARYADSNGYQGDGERTMWPWRDWVVEALNRNLPYDRFTIEQLAGDLLPDATDQQRLATAFCRNHMINGEGGRIPEENRVDYVMDMTETMGTVWLGLTLNCCRCHDHKFDPLRQRDYYQLTAFFNQTPVDGSGRDPQTPPVLAIPSAQPRWQLKDAEVPKVMVMADRDQRRTTYVLDRGLYNQPQQEVTADVPASLPPMAGDAPRTRLELARWLMAPENPLTARVTVNRYWQQLFGIGLVKTPEDFGVQGEIPLQQALLDYLAAELRDNGWDTKALVRSIVTSHTYRQSSRIDDPQVDPENRWLARGPRFRMPSWMLRDQALAASGLLVHIQGGPPVNGYQPPGVWEEATFGKKVYHQDTGAALYRRSLYTFWRRIIAPTMFFDSASRQTCSVTPLRTNTPLHALLTMNDVTYVEAARVLAAATLQTAAAGPGEKLDARRIDFVFRRLLARTATADEQQILQGGLDRARGQFAADPKAADALLAVGQSPRAAGLQPVEHASWTALCLAVLNLDETLTKE